MNWFGFGFNAFGQIFPRRKGEKDEDDIKVLSPVSLGSCTCAGKISLDAKSVETERTERKSKVVVSWSRRANIQINGDRHVCISGFINGSESSEECDGAVPESEGCEDALISEQCLTLSFADRVECWSLKPTGKVLGWSSRVQSTSDNTGSTVRLPLVPGGYVAPKPPFFQPLSPSLCAVSLVLGTEHAVLLTSSGTVYTWGSGSHGQLGHGSLVSEDEPQAVEALWGVPMKCVSAGGWHSASISAGGDLYVWGWNESGQIGLPSRGLKDESPREQSTGKGELAMDKGSVFISIQAFPALVDVPDVSEISKVSCGSRHTAAITSAGDIYTWGWGHYGQLGHGSKCSSDAPKIVEYFSNGGMFVEDVVCGPWNTFVSAVPRGHPPL